MKQTVEEAARDAIHAHYKYNGEYPCGERDYCEHCNGHNTAFDCCECGADEFKEGFISGAEWQSKQSPWISVKERLPEKNTGVFFTVEWKDSRKGYFVGLYYGNGQWESDNRIFLQDSPLYRITHYMPIPSFDDILEANRDVLERIKEKGD